VREATFDQRKRCKIPHSKTPTLNWHELILLQSQSVVTAAAKKPHLKVMCGFSRRFDASYRDAMDKMESGMIGRPSIFRSQTCDVLDPSGFFVAYAQFSGGIFVDCKPTSSEATAEIPVPSS